MSAQTGTSDVSKKLKAAIRAKLEELGVYVDDELPDYIMVMIANKKEKPQMKDDLGLFIGKSTSKFVDWLFDLFDRLQSASVKQEKASTSKQNEEDEKRAKEAERKREENERKEKADKEKERQREKDREREKEKEREREKKKACDEQKRKEREERDRKREVEKTKRRRSRSNTYSDEEVDKKSQNTRESRSKEKKRVASTVVNRISSNSPEPKLQSMVTVKRNVRPTGDVKNAKARSSMFLRAMNEASVSAGYGTVKKNENKVEQDEVDDMSDIESLPSKKRAPPKSIRERMVYPNRPKEDEPMEDDDSVVLNNTSNKDGPQMILKLTGGKEAIKRLHVRDRIVLNADHSPKRSVTTKKRRRDEQNEEEDEPKSKHERIVFDLSPTERQNNSIEVDSPTLRKWDGQIRIGESETSDEEAEIDAMLAEAREINAIQYEADGEEMPTTEQLSGGNFGVHSAPSYVPTPINALQDQNTSGVPGFKDESNVKERCIFWPKCTKGDTCQYYHPFKNCTNFPNCSFGNRCLFIHPACRFDNFCTKKQCPFTHYGTGGTQPASSVAPLTSNKRPIAMVAPKIKENTASTQDPVASGVLSTIAAKLAASLEGKKKTLAGVIEKNVEKKNDTSAKENVMEKPITEVSAIPLQNMIPCRYAGACRNPVCHFKHPKECRFGANCRNSSCYFYHKPSATSAPPTQTSEVAAKYKWKASTNQPTASTSAS